MWVGGPKAREGLCPSVRRTRQGREAEGREGFNPSSCGRLLGSVVALFAWNT